MKDIAKKFTKPRNLVVDAYTGTFSVSKACTFLSRRRLHIVIEENLSCVPKKCHS